MTQREPGRRPSDGRRIATLFDFNGVLIDDEAVHLASFCEIVERYGIVVTQQDYEDRYLGYDDAGAFQAMLKDAGREPTPEEIARLVAAKKPVYMRRIASDLRIFEGAVDLVRRRAERGVVGIVSGALRDEIEHALGAMRVRELVAFIVAAEDAPHCKPHPEGYLLALRTLGITEGASTAGVVVLEDSTAGVAAAKNASLRCAAVTHSYPEDKLRAAGADVVVDRLVDLTDELFDGEARA